MAPLVVTSATLAARIDPTKVIATFVRWGLSQPTGERIIPCHKIVTQGGEVDRAWWTVSKTGMVEPFSCSVGLGKAVGRWHRPQPKEVEKKAHSHATIPKGRIKLGCGLTTDAIDRFTRLHVESIGIKAVASQESSDWGLIQGVTLPETIKMTCHRPPLVPVISSMKIVSWRDNVVSQVLRGTPTECPLIPDAPLFLRTSRGGQLATVVAGDPAAGMFVLSPTNFSFKPDDLVCDLVQLDRSHLLHCPSGFTLVYTPHFSHASLVAPGAALIELDEGSLISSLTHFVPNLDYIRVDE